MAGLVLDTHSTIWYLESSPRLSGPALSAIRGPLTANEPIYVSTITLVEITYLVEKGRFSNTLLDRLLAELRQPKPELLVVPLDLATADILRTIPGSIVRDMPDRIIAATALALGVPLVTCDQHIHSSGIAVLW